MQPRSLRPTTLAALALVAVPVAAQQYGPAGLRHLPLGDHLAPIGIADLDGDGAPEIVDGIPDVWRNDGRAVFTVERSHLHFQAQRCAAGDLDGNGSTDLVFYGERTTPLVRLQLGNQFADHVNRDLFFASDVRITDLDGDGTDEVLVVSEYPTITGVYRLTGGTTLVRDTSAGIPAVETGDENPSAVRAADFDGDGDLDLLLVQNDRVEVFTNSGAATFAESQELTVPFPQIGDLRVADVDGDGDVDGMLVTRDGTTTLLVNDGTGRVALRTTTIPRTTDAVVDFHVADVDSDGDADLVIAAESLVAHVNDGAGRFTTATTLIAGWRPNQRAWFADFDADGRVDFLIDRGPSLHLQSTAGGFVPAGGAAIPASVGMTPNVITADFDGDGEVDLFGTASAPGALLLGDGRQSFRDASDRLPPLQRASLSAAAGDLDRDGDVDLVLGQFHAPSEVLLNDGTGRFVVASTSMANQAESTQAIAIGDLDGDGRPEVVTAGSSYGVTVWRNRMPQNLFATPSAMPAIVTMVLDIELVDLDGDGDLDMLCGIPGRSHPPTPGTVRRFDNDGTGRFLENTPIQPGGAGPVDSFDFDRDGDADLVIGQHVFENDGRGNFTPLAANRQPEMPLSTDGPVVADVDGDGFDDLLSTANGGLALHNDGRGSFTDVTASWMGSAFDFHTITAAADLDDDGDTDLVVRGTRGPALWVARSRDLQALAVPTTGGMLRYEIAALGMGGATAWLVFSTGPDTPTTLPGLGTLRLDPAVLIPGIAVALPNDRPFELATPVPNDPSLAGLRIDAQALIGSSPADVRLSNAVATQILR